MVATSLEHHTEPGGIRHPFTIPNTGKVVEARVDTYIPVYLTVLFDYFNARIADRD